MARRRTAVALSSAAREASEALEALDDEEMD
jgi:hypothetical protein